MDEVALDIGDDAASRGLLDHWDATDASRSGDATAAERTGELSQGAAAPTDVRLLGELLRFAGPDPEARARTLELEGTRTGHPPGYRAWLVAHSAVAITDLPSPPLEWPQAVDAPRARPPSFVAGIIVGVVVGLLCGVAFLLMEG